MPEQLTKHPEATLQVLRSAGAVCGEGAKQEVLVRCPADRFCKLPGGELCVYGLADASRMTQFTRTDWRTLQVSIRDDAPPLHTVPVGTFIVAVAAAAGAGMLAAASFAEARRRRRLRRERQSRDLPPPAGTT